MCKSLYVSAHLDHNFSQYVICNLSFPFFLLLFLFCHLSFVSVHHCLAGVSHSACQVTGVFDHVTHSSLHEFEYHISKSLKFDKSFR